jgi:hypothetical protein
MTDALLGHMIKQSVCRTMIEQTLAWRKQSRHGFGSSPGSYEPHSCNNVYCIRCVTILRFSRLMCYYIFLSLCNCAHLYTCEIGSWSAMWGLRVVRDRCRLWIVGERLHTNCNFVFGVSLCTDGCLFIERIRVQRSVPKCSRVSSGTCLDVSKQQPAADRRWMEFKVGSTETEHLQ